MSYALPIAAQRRGACPTLDAPMQTGDGLLARIRLAGGRIDPIRLERLASICGTYGNGVIEITARGNLQVRGLGEAVVSRFARDVRDVVAVETGLVVEVPPLAGDDPLEFVDPRPLAAAIKELSAPLAARLGPKVTVVVDGNGQIGLEALKADLRFVAVGGDRWLISVGAELLGTTSQPLDCARIMLTALANLGPLARATDLRDLDLGDLVQPSAPVRQPVTSPIGKFQLHRHDVTGLGLPFGAMAWESIAALAEDAWRFGISEFRLGPHHSLLAVGADDSLLAEAAQVGFIMDPRDPRTRIRACIGSAGCASGHIAARSDAARLALLLPANTSLHVSGCAKGCAHPGVSDVTLVGRSDGYGLVIHGRASDTPQALLRADQLGAVLAGAQG
ncbi:precorrin-3B synthase [Devosia sp. YR412]|uniref:precorrin-3B synthase n=1 Tax=Devosia sp. YR412 TaxID=1881030 RepID=UPI0008C6DED4|nr:precorrin-3B synthase [Devosia sp. YR412]SEP78870.1 precorrin-3B synthase [Devosia sp. YR412]